ncbi:MAG TPA: cysteine peptidase family C39 domain-containing protein, partial [Polyangiaceae bacterium]|nr:cysteine peptidase family C39 domain-containing protein [Polyangiaceae bacterium]
MVSTTPLTLEPPAPRRAIPAREPRHPSPRGSWVKLLGHAARELPFERRVLHFGEELWQQGAAAPGLAVISHGNLRLLTQLADQETHVVSLGPGETLGAVSLLLGSRELMTVRACSAWSEVWLLDPRAASSVLERAPVRRALAEIAAQQWTWRALRCLPGLAEVSDEALLELAAAGEIARLTAGARWQRTPARPGEYEAVLTGEILHVRDDSRRTLLAHDLIAPAPCHPDGVYEAIRRAALFRVEQGPVAALTGRFPELCAALLPTFDTDHTGMHLAVPRPPESDDALAGELSGGPRRGRIRRMPWVAQLDANDCGAACLAIVCRHYGRKVSIHLLRRLLHANRDGVHLRALCHASRQLGLAARSAKVSLRNLPELPLPAIVHLDGNHWAVLYDVTRRHVRLSDPAIGRVRLTRAEFEKRWNGFVALFDYTEDFAHAPEGERNTAWLWPFIRPWMGLIGQALLLAGVAAVVEGALPIGTQVIVDSVLVDRDVPLLMTVAAGFGAALVFLTLSMMLQRYLLSFVAVRIDGGSLDYLARKLLDLRLSYFEARRVGDLRRRIEGVRAVREFVIG